MEETKKAYNHEERLCDFPDCKNYGRLGGRHGDGTRYRRPWCKYHLIGEGRAERIKFAEGKKKYMQNSDRK